MVKANCDLPVFDVHMKFLAVILITNNLDDLIMYVPFIFRLILRCRQDARARFAKMRSDVLVKLELLDQKHGKVDILI